MLTEFFSQKVLSLASSSGHISTTAVASRDGSTWCCDILPADFTGGALELVKWAAGEQVAQHLDDLLNLGNTVLDPMISVSGSTLDILGLATVEIERFRLSIAKETSVATVAEQENTPTEALPADQVFTLAFSGALTLEGIASLGGDLVLQIKRDAPPALQFQLSDSSRFEAIRIPLPEIGPDLVLQPSVSAMDVAREKNTGSTTTALVSEGRIIISGGPSWLNNVLPDELAFSMSIASTKTLTEQSALLLSLTVPQVMDDVTVNLPSIPQIIPGFPALNFGAVNLLLSNLSVVLDGANNFKPYMTLDVGVGLPQALNDIISGFSPSSPILEFNTFDTENPDSTRVTGRVIVDEELVQFKPLTSPIKGIETTPISDVPGSQQGSTWIIDLGENGLLHIEPPTFAKSSTSNAMAASGGFEVKRPLQFSLARVKSLIDGLLFDGASVLLPSKIALQDINVLDGNRLNTTALSALWGGNLPSALNAVFSQLALLTEHLPDALAAYLNFSVPERFHYNVRMNADGSCVGGVKLPDDQPLRLLLPSGMSLFGLEIRQASLGQLNGGKLGVLELDVSVDHFFLPEVAAAMALGVASVPLLPSASQLNMQLALRKVVAVINFQSGAVIPLFYDNIGIQRLGVEGFELGSNFQLPKPTADIMDLSQLAALMVNFLTLPSSDERGLLDAAVTPEALSTQFVIGEQYLNTPQYTGDVLLGQRNDALLTVESSSLWPYLAHTLNFLKTGRVAEFLQAFPLDYRVGTQTLDFFGLASISVDWLISSPEEFANTAYPRLALNRDDASQLLALLPETEAADPNRLITLLRGEANIAGMLQLDSTFAFSGGMTGATTGFRFTGELAGMVGLDVMGKAAISLDPAGFDVVGAAHLTLFDTPVLAGEAGANNGRLYLQGALNLFPNSGILSLRADIHGQVSSDGVRLAGSTDFKVGGVSLINGEVILTHESLEIAGNFLCVETTALIGNDNGSPVITGALGFTETLSIRTQDIVVQGIKLSDPLRLDTSVTINLAIAASLNRFSLSVQASFEVLEQSFDVDFSLSVVPSDIDDLLSSLLARATELVQDFVTGLLNRPEKLLEVIARAALAATKVHVMAISIDSDDSDIGLLSLQSRLFNLTALAAYNGNDSLDNLFAYAQSTQSAMHLPSLHVQNIALALACNRSVRLPKLDQIKQYPLVKRLRNNDEIGANPTDATIAKAKSAVTALVSQLPRKKGTYTWAAGVQVSSFKLIHATNVFMTEMGSDLAAYLVGTASVKLPPKPLTTVVNMEFNYRASINLGSGSVKVNGKLTNNSYVLSKAAKLSGGFAYHSWLAGPYAGDFVLTMGGYAPDFNKPSHYPSVPRLKLKWRISSRLSAKGNMYMALTPTNIMAGGNLSAVFKTGPLRASFDADINFMMYWQPFFYKAKIDIDISAAVTLRVRISVGFASFTIRKTFRAGLGADLSVWGPKFAGKARVKWKIFSFTIRFGSSSKPKPRPISWRKFKADYLNNGHQLAPELNVTKGALSQINDGDTRWQVVDPDQFEVSVNSKFPLRQLTTKPHEAVHNDRGFTHSGRAFHLAPTKPSAAASASQWYLNLTYTAPAGMYFQGEVIERAYPKAVWGPTYTPKPSKQGTLSLLSGTRLVPLPGKPPGFSDAVDATAFKYQDVVENDPTWQWGSGLDAVFNEDLAANLTQIQTTMASDEANAARVSLAEFIGIEEPLSMAETAAHPASVFIGVPRSAIG